MSQSRYTTVEKANHLIWENMCPGYRWLYVNIQPLDLYLVTNSIKSRHWQCQTQIQTADIIRNKHGCDHHNQFQCLDLHAGFLLKIRIKKVIILNIKMLHQICNFCDDNITLFFSRIMTKYYQKKGHLKTCTMVKNYLILSVMPV